MAVAVSDLGTVEDTGNDNQSNFSFGSFGATSADRYLVACITGSDGNPLFSASSVTIGGVTATLTQPTNTNAITQSVVATALVPTGASGDVVVTWSEAVANDQLCTLLRVTGITTATPYDSDAVEDDNNTTTISAALDCEAGGVVIAVAAINGGRTWTPSLANEAADQTSSDSKHSHMAAWEVFGTFQSVLAVSGVANSAAREKTLAVVALTPVTSVDYTLACDTGAFTLTGNAATLSWGPKIGADPGAFVLTGIDAELRQGYGLLADVGSFTLTGNDVAFVAALSVGADAGTFTLTGNDAGLSAGYGLSADVGAFTLTGFDAELIAALSIAADAGSFTLTGQDADLILALTLNAEPGVFILTGLDATLRFSGWATLPGTGDWTTQTDTATWTTQSNSGSWTIQSGSATWTIQPNSGGWTVQ